jgi:3,4-dihydroxy 2-butanone 4-phosphate synthase/GTP cyclohydrolase II
MLTSIRGDRADDPGAGISPVLEKIKAARPALIIDESLDRGYIVCAADRASSEFAVGVATYGSGALRVGMEPERLTALELPEIHSAGGVYAPVDVIGAERGRVADRVRTLRFLARETVSRDQLVVPGHVVPVAAGDCDESDGACAIRAMVELVRLAGCAPTAAFAEAVDEQGFPADRRATTRLARRLNWTVTSVADVLAQVRRVTPAVSRQVTTTIPTILGPLTAIGFQAEKSGVEYVAFTSGPLADGMRIHLHQRCQISDVFGGGACGCGQVLRRALEEIRHSGNGAVIYYGDAEHAVEEHHQARRVSWPQAIELAGVLHELGASRVFLSSNVALSASIFKAHGISVMQVDYEWLGQAARVRVPGDREL